MVRIASGYANQSRKLTGIKPLWVRLPPLSPEKRINMRYLYHATPYDNLISIMEKGILPGTGHVVYLADSEIGAVKFVAVRGCKHILVVKVKILKADEKNIEETFDHSERFFGCRAFGHIGAIDTHKIVNYRHYDLRGQIK